MPIRRVFGESLVSKKDYEIFDLIAYSTGPNSIRKLHPLHFESSAHPYNSLPIWPEHEKTLLKILITLTERIPLATRISHGL